MVDRFVFDFDLSEFQPEPVVRFFRSSLNKITVASTSSFLGETLSTLKPQLIFFSLQYSFNSLAILIFCIIDSSIIFFDLIKSFFSHLGISIPSQFINFKVSTVPQIVKVKTKYFLGNP